MINRKKLILYLLHLIPPILTPKKIREVYNKIFFRKMTKHHFENEKKFFSRHAFINKAISIYDDCKYLEIGVADNTVFNSIPLNIENKYGVDPIEGGNYRMTSDEFFRKYYDLKFDVIFIDGLHEYKQCQRDCLNSMKHLKDGGIIFFHDFLPRSYFEENIPRKQTTWTGDVWKVAVELNNSINVKFKIINIDHGIGVLKINESSKYQKIDNLKNEGFKEYLDYRKKLPIISSEEGFDFISEKN